MRCKFFFLFCLLGLLITFSLYAEKKQKPVPLEALQDPKSPSYVPIPYPKTREEIITDLKYAIKKNFASREGKRSYGQQFQGHTILLKIIEDDPEYYIGRIANCALRVPHRADNHILIDLHNKSGKVIFRATLENSGNFSGMSFFEEDSGIPPLMTIAEVKDFFKSSFLPATGEIEVQSIEYERFIGHSTPMLRVDTTSRIFYLDIRRELFEVKKTEMIRSIKEFDMKLFNDYSVKGKKIPFDGILVDSSNNQALFLEKIEK